MTLRDDLEKVIQMGHDLPTVNSMNDFISTSTAFLRDHGQALLAAVRDAERWNEWCKHVDEADGEQLAKTHVEMILIDAIHMGSGCLEMFVDSHIDATMDSVSKSDPSEQVKILEAADPNSDIEPRLHSYDASGKNQHVYVIWPGGDRGYYVREAIDAAMEGGE